MALLARFFFAVFVRRSIKGFGPGGVGKSCDMSLLPKEENFFFLVRNGPYFLFLLPLLLGEWFGSVGSSFSSVVVVVFIDSVATVAINSVMF